MEFCPKCASVNSLSIVKEKENICIREEHFEVLGSTLKCSECFEEFSLDTEDAHELAKLQYAKEHDILIGADLIRIRQTIGLNQQELSKALNIPIGLIKRYEQGSLLSKEHSDAAMQVLKQALAPRCAERANKINAQNCKQRVSL